MLCKPVMPWVDKETSRKGISIDEFIVEADKIVHVPTGAWFMVHDGYPDLAQRCWGRAGNLKRQLEIQEIAAKLLHTRFSAADRVGETFRRWKALQIPDRTALYHTALDIKYRHGGLAEKMALVQLRYRMSGFRNNP